MWHRILFSAAWMLTALIARAACTGPAALEADLRAHPDGKSFTALGEWFEARHQYQCAVESYRSALEHGPGSGPIFERLGWSLYSAGDGEGAVSALRQSTDLDPRALGPHLKLAAVLEQLQRKAEAKAEWQRALEIDPNSVDALHGMSRHFLADGDYDSTITLLRPAPHNEVLTLDLAEAYAKAGLLKDADDLLSQALVERSGSLPLLSALTTVEVNEGLRETALHRAKQFADTHPGNAEAQKLYLRNLLANNDTSDAFPVARKLLTAAAQDPYLLYVMGVMERQNGDYTAARSHLQQALALEPDDYNSHYNLGLALVKLDEPRAAKEHLEKAVEIDPDMAIAQNQLGYLDSRGGDVAAAEKHFREAVRAAPAYTEAWINLAATLGMESKFQEAQQAIDSALKLEPKNSEALQLRQDLAASESQH